MDIPLYILHAVAHILLHAKQLPLFLFSYYSGLQFPSSSIGLMTCFRSEFFWDWIGRRSALSHDRSLPTPENTNTDEKQASLTQEGLQHDSSVWAGEDCAATLIDVSNFVNKKSNVLHSHRRKYLSDVWPGLLAISVWGPLFPILWRKYNPVNWKWSESIFD
jgi:hypothetical protein